MNYRAFSALFFRLGCVFLNLSLVLPAAPYAQAIVRNEHRSPDILIMISHSIPAERMRSYANDHRRLWEFQEIFKGSRGTIFGGALKQPFRRKEALAYYRSLPFVLAAEPNYQRKQTVIPNDPSFSLQTGLHQNSDHDIDGPEGWETTQGDSDIVIAILDSGVDLDHPDLWNAIWQNPGEIPGNSVDDDQNGFIDDVSGWDFVNYYNNGSEDNDPNPEPDGIDNNNDGQCPGMPGGHCVDEGSTHGTLVAGIANAKGNNGIGIAGVSWNTKIMVLRALSDEGDGFDSDIIAGIQYAIAKKADVLNMSFGSPDNSAILGTAIADAAKAGIVIVASAGNSSTDLNSTPFYPVCYDGLTNQVIGVAGVDSQDRQATFSNFGSNCVDVSAPSVMIYSTSYVNPAFGFADEYSFESGTSMASPFVAGLAGLVKSLNPNLSSEAISRTIIESSDDIGIGASYGFGRINIASTFARADTSIPSGSVVIENNAIGVNTVNAALTISGQTQLPDIVTSMAFSNDGLRFSSFEPFATLRQSWDLTDEATGGNSSEGIKTVFVKFKDSGGSVSSLASDSIIYDVTPPLAPIRIRAYEEKGGPVIRKQSRTNEQTPFFSWSEGSDSGAGIKGYYVELGDPKKVDPVSGGEFVLGREWTAKKIRKANKQNFLMQVIAMDNAGNIGVENSSFLLIFDAKVTKPSNFRLKNIEQGIRLEWGILKEEFIEAVDIDRFDDESGTFESLATEEGSAQSFVDKTARFQQDIRYRLRFIDDLGNRSQYSKIQSIRFLQQEDIVAAPLAGGGPMVQIFSKHGKLKSQFFVFEKEFRGGVSVAAGDLNGDGTDEIIAGRKRGGLPEIRVFNFSGRQIGQSFFPYDSTFRGGVSVAAGDLNGDGTDEIITGPGPGGGPHVRVFTGTGQSTMTKGFFSGPQSLKSGVSVATGDLDNNGTEEIIVGWGKGSQGFVRAFYGNGSPAFTMGFQAFAKNFDGGVSVASGDIEQSGNEMILAAPASQASPIVRIFSKDGKMILHEFHAFDRSKNFGLSVASGHF